MPFRCADCLHYCGHYVKFRESYIPLLYGHCVFPRLKKRSFDSPACKHFEAAEETEQEPDPGEEAH